MITAKRSSSDRTEAPAEARLELKLEKLERCCPSQAEHKTNEETNKRRGALKQVAIVFEADSSRCCHLQHLLLLLPLLLLWQHKVRCDANP